MRPSQSERPAYYEGQYLNAADLTAAVDYARIQQARYLLGAHTWGIAAGLQLKETPQPGGGVSVHVLPGYAWDGYGRPVVVLSPYRIPEDKFSKFTLDQPNEDLKGKLIPVWISYDESDTPAGGSDTCDPVSPSPRIQERFRIEAGEMTTADRSMGINVAGRSVSDPKTALKAFDSAAPLIYDESIPHQDLAGLRPRARWLIPLGFVRWLPGRDQPGHFLARDDGSTDKDSDKIRRARRYVGAVVEEIAAADGAIRIRNRGTDPATSSFESPRTGQPNNDLVLLEGNLRVEGDTRACGSLEFLDSTGKDRGVPFWIRRNDTDPAARSLQIAIGPKAETTNRVAFVTLDGDQPVEEVVVMSGGRVGIGTSNPVDKLHVMGDLRIAGAARKLGEGGWTHSSDARLKQKVVSLDGALTKLLQLQGVSFEWKEPDRMGSSAGRKIGLVAQDVEKVFPEWVSEDAEGYRELTVRGFEALVVEALRELKTEVNELKTRLDGSRTQKPTPKRARAKKRTPAAD